MIRREFMNALLAGTAGLCLGGRGMRASSGTPGENPISSEALALHKKAVIIDGHNDSLIEHWARKESYDLGRDWPDYNADLGRMKMGGLTAMNSMVGDDEIYQGLELWSAMFENLDNHPRDFTLIDKAEDIIQAKKEGRVGLIGQLEGLPLLQKNLHVLRVLYKLGVRVAGLTHGEGGGEFDLQRVKSPSGYLTPDDREAGRRAKPGLTDFGREAVLELNRLGIVVDLAHTNDAVFYEALELSSAPVEFSHGNVFALSPHARNLTDDQLKALAANGGVIGIACYPNFVDRSPEKRTLDRFVDHIEYVCELVGDDHVGFGSDYDGMGREIVPIVPSYAEMPLLTQKMLDRGFGEETILKFWGGNFFRVMKKALAKK